MKYRTFGKLDWKPSALGFGAMRLPTLDEDEANIDEAEATRMIRHAIDRGVNYVDTAYPYHRGNSEKFLGRALADGYRERVKLATKLPCWLVETADDFDRLLNEQLERLQTDHIDFYLLHALNAASWPKMRALGVLQWAEGAIADGRIRHLGFSFHDSVELFEEIIDAYDQWTFCQIQYNYMDESFQAGTRGLEYAAAKGLAVIAMEPVRGGRLAGTPHPVIRKLWDRTPVQRTPADWALQWVWNRPEVSLLLSGMSTMEQVQQNLASAEQSEAGHLTPEELALVAQVKEAYARLSPVGCTDCKYCMPCPREVDIPRCFNVYNEAFMYGIEHGKNDFFWIPEKQKPAACIQCGECETRCPQNLPIMELLGKADQLLAGKQNNKGA